MCDFEEVIESIKIGLSTNDMIKSVILFDTTVYAL